MSSQGRPAFPQRALWLFSATILTSALLLFIVEPLVGRLLLPEIGGGALAWNTSQVFFQVTLLAGYLYAHLLSRYTSLFTQYGVHFIIVTFAFVFLPIHFSFEAVPSGDIVSVWLLGQLVISVGLPFFALSATAPLFHRWFAQTNHPDAEDAFHLYAASNLGTMAALIGYPLLLEPNLALEHQNWVLTAGFVLLVLLQGGCAVWVQNHLADQSPEPSPPTRQTTDEAVSGFQWAAWGFVPSAMYLSVTNHITTNLASLPFLWIPPLAIYMLTFVLAFGRRRWIDSTIVKALFPSLGVFILVGLVLSAELPTVFKLSGHLVFLFVVALMFHSSIYEHRPKDREPTRLYVWMSFGGFLGGVFVAILAPVLFEANWEYPLVILLAFALYPSRQARTTPPAWMELGAGIVALSSVFAILLPNHAGSLVAVNLFLSLLLALLVYWARNRPVWFRVGTVVLMSLAFLAKFTFVETAVFQDRSYYGRVTVYERELAPDKVRPSLENSSASFPNSPIRVHELRHGDTIHGLQFRSSNLDATPLAYYGRQSGIGRIFDHLNSTGRTPDVGVVGLGIGTLATYVQPNQRFIFFEIDSLVADVAQNSKLFTFLEDCGGRCNVIIGDGRKQLEKQDPDQFGLLVIDAFNSGAIPTHLCTREALATYMSRLHDGGLLAAHTSNPHLDLGQVFANLANDANLEAWKYEWTPPSAAQNVESLSQWTFVVQSHSHWAKWFEMQSGFEEMNATDDAVWTDDYANVVGAMLREY